jgi:uncharacterized membrane protein YfcA
MRFFNRDEHDKLRVRRHIAIACLALNCLVVVALIVAIFYGPPDRAGVIDSASAILLAISALIGGWTGAWFHAAFKDDKDSEG